MLPILLLVIAAAFYLRVAYVDRTEHRYLTPGDSFEYILYGYNLAEHGVYSMEFTIQDPKPDAFRSPGFPALIAAAFLAGGIEFAYPVIIYLQVVLGTLTVWLTFAVGRRFLNLPGAMAAACLTAFSPHLVAMTSYVLSETMFSLVLLLALERYLAWNRRPDTLRALLAGCAFGCGTLINAGALLLPVFLVVLQWLRLGCIKNSKGVTAKQAVIFILVCMLLPLAWELRTIAVVPKDAPTGFNRALSTLSHGTYPDFIYETEAYQYYPYREDPEQPAFGTDPDVFFSVMWERVRQSPLRYVRWYLMEKPVALWGWDNLQSHMGKKKRQGQGDVYIYEVVYSLYHVSSVANGTHRIMRLLHPALLIAALCAGLTIIYLACRTSPTSSDDLAGPWSVFATLVYFTLLYTVFVPYPRYSIPLRPELFLLAVWGFEQAWAGIRSMMPRSVE